MSTSRLGLALAFVSLLATGCVVHMHSVRGSGNRVTRSYPVANFDRVQIGSALNLEIRQGPQYALQVTADDNAFEVIEVRNSGGVLRIRTRPNVHLRNVDQTAVLVMPDLAALDVSGAANVEIANFRVGHDVAMDVSGASDVSGHIDAGDLDVDLSGASGARLAGTAGHCRIDGSGASGARLDELHCSHAAVDLSGSADADVTVLVELGPVELSGASSLTYRGPAAIRDVSTSGASHLRRR